MTDCACFCHGLLLALCILATLVPLIDTRTLCILGSFALLSFIICLNSGLPVRADLGLQKSEVQLIICGLDFSNPTSIKVF